MGFTPTLVSGVWVGGDDRDIHFDSMQMGQGATMALPIWAYYMRRVFNDPRLDYSETATFDLPEGYNPCETSEYDVPEFNDIEEVFE